ncbi:MAG TPA: hypothetical protein VFG20_23355, partial [Planctomycetaceae bacterium]|nr:hypothetical protein [Planctomycetaceae bacterium]
MMQLTGRDNRAGSLSPVTAPIATVEFDPGSYRDRAARVCRTADGRVLRYLSPAALLEWQAISPLPFFRQAMESGRIVGSQLIDTAPSPRTAAWAGVLEHEVISFISYPYEWAFSMLRDAALLHLELLREAVTNGCTIKDGTAYNVQFHRGRPTFIDVTSFERLPAGTPWVGYRQFCQTFLFPLMLQAYRNLPFQPWLRGRLEGITPQECWQAMSLRDLFRRGVLTHVALHATVEARTATSSQGTAQALSQAGFQHQMILNSIRNLQRTIEGLRWSPPKTTWSDYGTGEHYTEEDSRQKERFLRQTIQFRHWKQVWDLGGNIGHYAEIAA